MKKYSKVKKRPNKRQWAVYSSKGKKLSQWYPSRKKAVERLRQIEYFKNNASDHELGLSDIVNHRTLDDNPLSVKPGDGQFTYKQAFGLTPSYVNAAPTHLEFDEELSDKFFGGDSYQDYQNSNSISVLNDEDKVEIKDLIKKLKKLKQDKEASKLFYILKKATFEDVLNKGKENIFDKEYGLSQFLPDIPVETLTKEEKGSIPFFGNYGHPLSVNANEILLTGQKLIDTNMSQGEVHYNSFKNSQDAMNKFYQEAEGILAGGGIFDTNEVLSFAAFLYLMHNGYNCSDIVFVKTKDGTIVDTGKTIEDYVKKTFNSIWSDWLIPGMLFVGGFPVIFNMFPDGLVGKTFGFGAAILGSFLGPGGHIVENLSLYKLCLAICKELDKNKFKFIDGRIVYLSGNKKVIPEKN